MKTRFLLCVLLWVAGPVSQASDAQNWLMMVMTRSTDPARDSEFNRWYDDIDIPDVLQVPGYKRARRGLRLDTPYLPRSDQNDDGTYVALYDILSQNIDHTIIDMLMATRKMESVRRSTDLLKVTERLYFRQMGPPVEATSPPGPAAHGRSFLFLERVDCCRDEATDAQLGDWYDVRHVPDMLKIPGFVRATRFQLYRVLMVEPKSAPRFLTVYEVNANSADEALSLIQTASRKRLQEGRSSDLFIERGSALFLKINDVTAH